MLKLLHLKEPISTSKFFPSLKDPCLVFDGTKWHVFGSGDFQHQKGWRMFYATSTTLEGQWSEEEPINIAVDGECVAAPGVFYDLQEKIFHMFIQTSCYSLGGTIEHL